MRRIRTLTVSSRWRIGSQIMVDASRPAKYGVDRVKLISTAKKQLQKGEFPHLPAIESPSTSTLGLTKAVEEGKNGG